MATWTRAVLRYRWPVVAVWAAAVVVSTAAAVGLTDLLTNRFLLPGTETAKTEMILRERFGESREGSFLVATTSGSAARLVPALEDAAERSAARVFRVEPSPLQPAPAPAR